jgi:hypothetical protein
VLGTKVACWRQQWLEADFKHVAAVSVAVVLDPAVGSVDEFDLGAIAEINRRNTLRCGRGKTQYILVY